MNKIDEAIMRIQQLKPNQKLVLLVLNSFNLRLGGEEPFWPSIKSIVAKSSLSKRCVQGTLRRIETLGLIHVERPRGRTASTYQFKIGKLIALAAQNPSVNGAERAGSTGQSVRGQRGRACGVNGAERAGLRSGRRASTPQITSSNPAGGAPQCTKNLISEEKRRVQVQEYIDPPAIENEFSEYDSNLWDVIKARLVEEIDKESFDAWIEPIPEWRFRGDTLELHVPSDLFKGVIRQNYAEQIEAIASEIAGREVRLAYQVEPDE